MSDRALIVFGKNPVPGQVKTRLAATVGDVLATGFYRASLLDSLEQYGRFDADVRLYLAPSDQPLDPSIVRSGAQPLQQHGDTLGERMKHAFEETFGAGYRRAAIVGSDHPTLPSSRITDAFEELRNPRTVVLGPSEDGGYYLMGLSEPRGSLFAEMTYSHGRVLEETRRRVVEAGLSVHTLDMWYDVDTMADVRRLIRDLDTSTVACPRTRVFLLQSGLIENASLS